MLAPGFIYLDGRCTLTCVVQVTKAEVVSLCLGQGLHIQGQRQERPTPPIQLLLGLFRVRELRHMHIEIYVPYL